MSISTSSKISGKPVVSGSYTVTFKTTDRECTDKASLVLKVLNVSPKMKGISCVDNVREIFLKITALLVMEQVLCR
ncbi:MAG: hypothetical protein IJU26_00195 [Synergistaceae bacterium]|nr:hypothetical protein [Synergistaceae bacterium]